MNRILQFTYIARPLVSEQCVNRLRSQFNVCIPEAGSVQLQKMFRQRQDVARTLAQGREVDRRDIQPIIQILAKTASRHGFIQFDIGGRDQPNIDGDRLT